MTTTVQVDRRELERLRNVEKNYTDTLAELAEYLGEKLEHERELRTKAEERAEHLQNEVSDLRRELQRRDESNSEHIVTYSWAEPSTTTVRTVSTYPTTTTIPSSGTYTSGYRITKTDHTV